jgi:hypothetical protein
MSASPRSHGVLLVHGIGSQRQSDTLIGIGDKLLDWLTQWCVARGQPAPRLEQSELCFASESVDGVRSSAIVTLPTGERWVLTEAWWAASVRRQKFSTMAWWAIMHLWQAAWGLIVSFAQRLGDKQKDPASVSWLLRRALTLYTFGTLVLFVVGALLGLPLVILILILAQIPIPTVQAFFLGLLQPFLEVNVGEFRTVLDDEIQAANIRRVVAAGVEYLHGAGCEDVTIVAHSEGAVISLDMLTDPAHHETAGRVRKLLTAGAGLNKAWAFRPDLTRLQHPLPGHIRWIDFWGSFDPVPTGWLNPPKDEHGWVTIYDPEPAIAAEQGLVKRADPNPFAPVKDARGKPKYWPESVKVTNALSVLADHGEYWNNDEEVLTRVAAEIDAAYYRDSGFWMGQPAGAAVSDKRAKRYAAAGEGAIRERVRKHRERAILLAFVRVLFILAWLALVGSKVKAVEAWLYDHRDHLPVPGWLTTVLDAVIHLPALRWFLALQGWLAQPLSDHRNLLGGVTASVLLGIPVVIGFLGAHWLWSRWNDREKRRAIMAIARGGQETAVSPASVVGASPAA